MGKDTKAIFDGKNKADAEARAMKRCNEHDTSCAVYHEACSLPIGI